MKRLHLSMALLMLTGCQLVETPAGIRIPFPIIPEPSIRYEGRATLEPPAPWRIDCRPERCTATFPDASWKDTPWYQRNVLVVEPSPFSSGPHLEVRIHRGETGNVSGKDPGHWEIKPENVVVRHGSASVRARGVQRCYRDMYDYNRTSCWAYHFDVPFQPGEDGFSVTVENFVIERNVTFEVLRVPTFTVEFKPVPIARPGR